MTDKKKTKLHICITIAVMLFIFMQSAMPGKISGAESNIIVQFIAGITGWDEEVLSVFVRKAAHFTEFLILGICLCVNMRDLKPHLSAGYILAAWIIGTAYAMTDELHQLFVPGRVCSLTDVCIDSAGVACGIIVYLLFRHNREIKIRVTGKNDKMNYDTFTDRKIL